METTPETNSNLAEAAKRVGQRLLALWDNRVELLTVELQEAQERARLAVFLGAGAGVLALLAGMAATAAIAVAAGRFLLVALVILAVLYAAGAVILVFKLARLWRDWEMLSGTQDQLRKDRECLRKRLG